MYIDDCRYTGPYISDLMHCGAGARDHSEISETPYTPPGYGRFGYGTLPKLSVRMLNSVPVAVG